MVSAGLTALLSIFFSILSATLPQSTVSTDIRSKVDTRLQDIVSTTVIKWIGKQKAIRWAMICYNVIFSLGDQQLTTSLALLVATVKKLHSDKTLSVYHLNVAYNLSTLVIIAFVYMFVCWRIDQASMPDGWKEPARILRIPLRLRGYLVFTTSLLLIYCFWVIAKAAGLEANCPAACFQNATSNGPAASPSDVIFLVFGFIIIIPASISILRVPGPALWAKHLLENYGQKLSQQHLVTVRQKVHLGVLTAHFLLIREASGKWFGLLVANLAFLAMFSLSLTGWTTQHRPSHAEDLQDERSMGFGQMMALFLLVQPVLQLLDSISGRYPMIWSPSPLPSSYPYGPSNTLTRTGDFAQPLRLFLVDY